MPAVSIIVPTYNEFDNIRPLIRTLHAVLSRIDHEIVIVDDDSPDGTAALARSIAQQDNRVRVIHRIGRKGLASACVEGILSTSSPLIAVMDADFQHDYRILPAMLSKLEQEALDIVVGSRNSEGGSMGSFTPERVLLSNAGRAVSRYVCHTAVSDPMSGYFVCTREFFDLVVPRLSSVGFKILVDMLASCPRPVRIGEVGYRFGSRAAGESKLDFSVAVEFLQLVLSKLTRGWVPVGYLLFAFVGSVGVLSNVAITAILYRTVLPFQLAHIFGAVLTVALNFFLNNIITFRSSRLRGIGVLKGLVSFYAGCSIGLLAQFGMTSSLTRLGLHWTWATFAGAVIGSVWNYSIAYLLVWQVNRRRRVLHRHAPVLNAENGLAASLGSKSDAAR